MNSPTAAPSVHDALGSIGSGIVALVVALARAVTGLGALILHDPAVMVTGIVIGLIAGAVLWLAIFIVRRFFAGTVSPVASGATAPKIKSDLQTLPIAEVEKQLGSSPNGLTQAEASKRLIQYGPNEIAEQQRNAILDFLKYFWGPIPWMIEVAVVLSAAVQHWPDFCIILVLLCANATIGFWEERQAHRRHANWCRAILSVCGWAISCRPTRACSPVTRFPSISLH